MIIVLLAILLDRSPAVRESPPAPDVGQEMRIALLSARMSLLDGRYQEFWRHVHSIPEFARDWEWRHLASEGDRSLSTPITGFDNAWGLAVMPGSRRIAASGEMNVLVVHDLDTGKDLLRRNPAHGPELRALAFTPSGLLLSGSRRHASVRVWNVDQGRVLEDLNGHEKGISSIVVSGDGHHAVSTSLDRTARANSSHTTGKRIRV